MKINRLISLAIFITITIGFTACGGGGGGSDGGDDDVYFKNSDEKIRVVGCDSSTNMVDYTTMLSGDTLIQEATNTTVETYHSVDNTKRVCTKTGISYLVRKEG